HGEAAGASQPHAHTQIVALPVTPLTLAIELQSAMKHFAEKERCLFCDIMNQEVRENRRIIQENDLFIAFAPYASRFPFEVTVMPKKHAHDFREVGDGEMASLAAILQDVILRIKIGLHDPAYNIMIHTSPNPNTWTPRPTHWNTIRFDWHWHIEIFPRLTSVAGFEWGTGFFINPTPPEQAADVLRSIELE
ncbi:DUF4921 family protein, partial [bacterium]|nr:DUF4921 family protein [bacterium]